MGWQSQDLHVAASRIVSQYFACGDDELIEEACGDDTQLRREVEWMIAECEKVTGAHFAVPAIATADHAPDQIRVAEAREYRVIAPLGFGGMGSVHLAHRVDGDATQPVALKIMSSALFAGPGGAAQFLHERRILAELAHPNIAHLTDGGYLPDGRPFLAMEYIEGKTIDQFCRDHVVDAAQLIRLFLPILGALSYAHQKLLVHRDIKPSNILVTRTGVPKVVDFGIADFIDDASAPGAARPRAFTPAYASPEQSAGRPIGTATDQYAIGVVLRELLEDVSVRTGRGVPKELRSIIEYATRPDPATRYPSVDALSKDLEAFLAHRPVTAHGNGWTYRARKYIRRNRWGVAAAGSLLVALGSFAAYREMQLRAIIAEQQRVRDLTAIGVRAFEMADVTHAPGRKLDAKALLDQGVQQLTALSDVRLRTKFAIELALKYERLREFDAAQQLAESILRWNSESAGALGEQAVVARSILSRSSAGRDNVAGARYHGDLAVSLLAGVGNASDAVRSEAYKASAVAWSADPNRDIELSRQRFEQAATAAEASGDAALVARVYTAYSRAELTWVTAGGTAVEHARMAVTYAEKSTSGDKAVLLDARIILGIVLTNRAQLQAAADLAEGTLQMAREMYVPGHRVRCNAMVIYLRIFQQTPDHFDPVLDEYGRESCDRSLIAATAVTNLAHMRAGDPDTPRKLDEFAAVMRAKAGPYSRRMDVFNHLVSVYYRNIGDHLTAEKMLVGAREQCLGRGDCPPEFLLSIEQLRVINFERTPGLAFQGSAIVADARKRFAPQIANTPQTYWWEMHEVFPYLADAALQPPPMKRLEILLQRACTTAIAEMANVYDEAASMLEGTPEQDQLPLVCSPAMPKPPLARV